MPKAPAEADADAGEPPAAPSLSLEPYRALMTRLDAVLAELAGGERDALLDDVLPESRGKSLRLGLL